MRNVLIALLFSTFSMSVSAFYTLSASCFVNNGRSAVCTACNYRYTVARCQMGISGRTFRGAWINGQQYMTLLPGQCAQGYVFANNAFIDPLRFANANVRCN